METLMVLALGFLIGMRHAVEADHLAAVAALATRAHSLRETVKLGVSWGMGHTLTLFLLGSVVLFANTVVAERFATWLEFIVGIMLLLLGLDVIRRMWCSGVHFHVHEHGDGVRHFHAHAHEGKLPHDADPHEHEHRSLALSLRNLLAPRALLVGMVHGMAGTAALVLLTLQTLSDVWLGLVYILVFGAGSIIGMGAVSAIIAMPMRAAGHRMTRWNAALQYGVGAFTAGLGLFIIAELAPQVLA